MRFHVGMSGWTFPGWRGGFYPKGLAQKKELEYSSRQVTSIEINGTFYRIQKPESFQSWYEITPDDFVFSLKAPQFITHIRRLKEVETAVANFLASGMFRLKQKLGPILWQFPPSLSLKDDRFEKFIQMLPKDVASAGKLAKKHSDWMKGKTETSTKGVSPIRHAFEFRHPSFFNKDFLQFMQAHGVAIVFAHGGNKDLFVDIPTTDFVYCRMHGEGKDYKKGYPKKTLEKWAIQLKAQPNIQNAYIYFDTEAKQYAPTDAKNLLQILSEV